MDTAAHLLLLAPSEARVSAHVMNENAKLFHLEMVCIEYMQYAPMPRLYAYARVDPMLGYQRLDLWRPLSPISLSGKGHYTPHIRLAEKCLAGIGWLAQYSRCDTQQLRGNAD